jgi:hypothetical protein
VSGTDEGNVGRLMPPGRIAGLSCTPPCAGLSGGGGGGGGVIETLLDMATDMPASFLLEYALDDDIEDDEVAYGKPSLRWEDDDDDDADALTTVTVTFVGLAGSSAYG